MIRIGLNNSLSRPHNPTCTDPRRPNVLILNYKISTDLNVEIFVCFLFKVFVAFLSFTSPFVRSKLTRKNDLPTFSPVYDEKWSFHDQWRRQTFFCGGIFFTGWGRYIVCYASTWEHYRIERGSSQIRPSMFYTKNTRWNLNQIYKIKRFDDSAWNAFKGTRSINFV